MNTSNIADLSDIIGSIGIVITLIFLVLQMRENTRAIEASTRQAARDADAQNLITAIDHPEAILSMTKSEFTDEELVQQTMWLVLLFRTRENDWFQYQRGIMDVSTWKRYASSFTGIFIYERNRNWWINYGTSAFNPGFVEEVNNILEKIPVSKGLVENRYKTLFESPDVYQEILKSRA